MSEEPRRRLPFHPVLVSVFPILAVYSANVGLFPLRDLIRPLLFATLASTILLLVFAGARRSFERGAIVSSVAFVGLWGARSISSATHLPDWTMWLVMMLFVGAGWWWSHRPALPTNFLNRFSLLLVVVAGVTIGLKSRPNAPPAEGRRATTVSRTSPDVFFILLDGYGRQDQLKRVFGFDSSPFVDELKGQGFFVAERARSNYCQTSLSLASALNLDWIQGLFPKGNADRLELNSLVDRPKVVRDLRAIGYDTVAISTGFPGFDFSGFDLVIDQPAEVTYFESTLLELTPISMPGQMVDSQYDRRRLYLVEGFGALNKMAARTAKPRFVFAHILAPHPPFVFDAEEPVRPRGAFSYQDGSDYFDSGKTAESYASGYVGQLRWLNVRVIETVRTLVNRPGPKPIVMILSDHGSKLHLDQNDLSKTDVQESFSTLGAYLVPEDLRGQFGDEETPLSAMRKVHAYITGLPAPRSENRSYYSPFSQPDAFVEVTDRVR